MANAPPAIAKPIQVPATVLNAAGSVSGTFSDLNKLLKGISDVSPILITGFMFMNTVFNYDLKAVFWVAPLILWISLMRYLQSKMPDNMISNPSCSKIWGKYKSPSLSSFFIMYTLGYIATPMPIYNDWNIVAVLMFVALFTVDATVRLKSDCSTRSGVAVGGLGGLIMGIFMYFVFSWVGLSKFLYFNNSSSNNTYCTKPTKQNFKCYVYKNGNIISSI
jgi:hypothetical protein